MRILCLHGSGASGDIMKSQIAGIASHLPSTHEFDYLDSPLESSAAQELRDVYPGPYYCFFNQYSSSEIQSAVGFVREIVEEDGPYDAVIGFSQGAAVAAAYISSVSSHYLDSSLQFKLAIFICAALIPPQVATGTELVKTIGALGQVDIPTVHVVGRKDPCSPQSLELAKSCEKGTSQTLMSNEGHEVPRDSVAVRSIAAMIEKASRLAFSG